jgi:DNA mismatch repair protein MutS
MMGPSPEVFLGGACALSPLLSLPVEMAASDDTPLMQQWRAAKARHPDALLLFRVGDFYELFHEDAREASRLLGLTLTARNNGAAAQVPMAGLPARALDEYLTRLVRLGCRAAICDQVEDAAQAKGVVRREVVETVTPGTVLQDALLQAGRNNFLVALAPESEGRVGLAASDLSTGEFFLQAVDGAALTEELGRIEPAELLVPRSMEPIGREAAEATGVALTVRDDGFFHPAEAREILLRHYRIQSLDGLGILPEDLPLIQAGGALLQYLTDIQPAGVRHLSHPRLLRTGAEMRLDEMTRRNLELVEPLRSGEEGGTLVSVLDRSVTSMGARLLRRWILRPLLEPEEIWRRQDAVEELVEDPALRQELRRVAGEIQDLERLSAKAAAGRITPRELRALGRSLARLPVLQRLGSGVKCDLLRELAGEIDPLEDLTDRIDGALADEPPAALQEGGVIRPGYSPELDELRQIRNGARDFIAALQTRERERTGIASLKVGFNRVFGYYLEVTQANADRVPEDYLRKQTLANAERFFTPELKAWEEKVMGAEDRILTLESELFLELRQAVSREVPRLQRAGSTVASLDVLSTLAEVADRQGYVRPRLHTGFDLRIEGGRHPVVETMMPREAFIPNDLVLDAEGWLVILTGPNMAGKSTVLRQIGLIQLLGQIGSFVPAQRAELPLCDRIFTRVGASDNLARGQSTFMVEMNETAAILHSATRRSLVLLDEIGRGTSTYDGVSIAWAVSEYLHERVGAKTIFATHYHELTQLGDLLPAVVNMNVAVRESGEDIVFLRRLESGGADRSYGIQVARLAGIPPEVIARARELLRELEGTHSRGGEGLGRTGTHLPTSVAPPDQLSLFQGPEDPLRIRLRALVLDELTPLAALNLLAALREEARASPRAPGGGAESPESPRRP